MKWMMLSGVVLLSAGCCGTTDVVEYQQVVVARPVVKTSYCCTASPVVSYAPVVTRVVTPVLQPTIVDYSTPIFMNTTAVDFY